MKTIEIPGTSIETSRLGFGCAPILGRVSERDALLALSHAYDAGVRHFDVARSYGWGEAEQLLGRFLADKRQHVTITTKCGIVPPVRSAGLSLAKSFARQLISRVPALRKYIARGAGQLMKPRTYSPDAVSASVHQSLQELRTDYLDVLLLHEVGLDSLTDELMALLLQLRAGGVIREFGIATSPEESRRICEAGFKFPIVQTTSNVLEDHVPMLRALGAEGLITHTPLGGAARVQTMAAIMEGPLRAQIERDLAIEVHSSEVVASLMLSCAMRSVSPGVVVCSMFTPRHIDSNVRVAEEQLYTDAQLDQFASLVRGALGTCDEHSLHS